MKSPERQFVERTIETIDQNYEGQFEVTYLINLAFGTVIFPYERVLSILKLQDDKKGWWNKSGFWSQNLKGLDGLPVCITEYLKNNPEKKNHFPKPIGELFYKLRNLLCHKEFLPIHKAKEGSDYLQFIGITLIANEGTTQQWELEIKQSDLKELLKFIGNAYIDFLNTPEAQGSR